jgi:hypothetical protein
MSLFQSNSTSDVKVLNGSPEIIPDPSNDIPEAPRTFTAIENGPTWTNDRIVVVPDVATAEANASAAIPSDYIRIPNVGDFAINRSSTATRNGTTVLQVSGVTVGRWELVAGSSLLTTLHDGSTAAVSSILRNQTLTVDSIADLRTALTAGVAADVYIVRWHTSRAAQGGGRFFGSAIGALVDDDGVTITGGTLAAVRDVAPSDAVDPRWFGALCAGANESAAVQSCIAYCYTTTHRQILLPTGLALGTSINATYQTAPQGLEFVGQGKYSLVTVATSGTPAFDFTGNGYCSMRRVVLQCLATDGTIPSCFLLVARRTGNASAGWHVFEEVQTVGNATLGHVISLSSELNKYINCTLDNRQASTTTLALHDQNYLSVASAYQTFPTPFAGGNTVHQITGGWITTPGGTGIGTDISGALDVSFHGVHHNGSGAAGIRFSGNSSSIIEIAGGSTEWSTTHGIQIDAGITLENISISGFKSDEDIYGADTSVVRRLTLTSSNIVPGMSFATLADSEVETGLNGNGVTIRAAGYNNHIDSPYTAGDDVTEASINYGSTTCRTYTGGDSKQRFYRGIGTSKRDRLETHAIVAKGSHHPIVTEDYTLNWYPDVDLGTTFYMVQTGQVNVANTTGGDWAPTVTGEPNSVDITMIFKQDGTGGHAIAFGALWKTTWVPSTAANAINTITFRYILSIGFVEIASAVGLA